VAHNLGTETGEDNFQPLRFGQVLAITETVVCLAINNIKFSWPHDDKVVLPYYEAIKTKEHPKWQFYGPRFCRIRTDYTSMINMVYKYW
jgi:hypothetical protein